MAVAATDDTLALIRDSAADLADRRDLTRIRRLRYQLPGFSREVWADMCGLGWPGLRLDERHGGSALGMAECCALSEALGSALAPEPLTGAALAARALTACEPAALDAVLTGERLVLAAWQETPQALEAGTATAFADGRVSGRKVLVPMGAGADAFVVMSGRQAALIARDAPGVSFSTLPTQDGGHYLTIDFAATPARPVECAVGPALAEATLSTAAYLLGLLDEALARTLAYLCERVQFGVPIGSFQVLQHRAVDLKLQAELARASVRDAASTWDGAPGTPAALAAVSRAKARASDAALLITRQAIQMHGGIGYADEHDIGLYLRKAMVLSAAYGGAATHRRRFSELVPLPETGP